ncbi:MAG: LCP family protein [Ruminococcus sp.]|nr:LCP family protein [Ruminococcus sp.]
MNNKTRPENRPERYREEDTGVAKAEEKAADTQPDTADEQTEHLADAASQEQTAQAVPVQELGQGEDAEANSSFDIQEDDEEYVDKTRVMPREDFEYVVPKESFKEHARRRHRSSTEHTGSTKKATEEEMKEAEEGFVFLSPRRRRKHKHHGHRHRKFRHMALWKRILIILAAVLLIVVILLGSTFLILHEIGRRGMHTYENAEVVTPAKDESGDDIIMVDQKGRVITYDGVTYELNEDLISVTFIGADEGTGENADLQMSDAIYILTADTNTGKVKILGISRDTMADVDLYSKEGSFIDTERRQIAFSYAYGNDTVTGGKNTTTSLGRLFYGLPFDNYFAINMKALITLNDTIGGVTLTSSMTFTSPIDGRTISEGETVTLHGKEADYYVRYRDTEKLDSNNDRMRRQQEYIRAFLNSIIPAAKKDISIISKLYDEIQVNSDTTLDLSKMTYIASTALTKLRSASDIEYVALPGVITEGEYAELNPTNEDTMRTMLDVFYTPLAEVPENTQ